MKITFDTENDSVQELQTVLSILNSALQNRPASQRQPKDEGEVFGMGKFVEAPKSEQFINGKYQYNQTVQQEQKAPQELRTSGGGRVIPYRDMSQMMSNIFSNQPTRRTR